jgi:hypothetical protein
VEQNTVHRPSKKEKKKDHYLFGTAKRTTHWLFGREKHHEKRLT